MQEAGSRKQDEEEPRRTMKSYRDLEVYQLARELSVEIHRMSLEYLPKFELYEEGAQIRRSVKSIRSNIVEGYGRRRYKADFIKFLVYAHSSCDETTDHLLCLLDTGSLRDEALYQRLNSACELLGSKLHAFIGGVERNHRAS